MNVDDDWDVTWADQFSDQGGHLPIDGCTSSTVDKKGKLKTTIDSTCVDAAASRTIADAQTFKIIVVNASPNSRLLQRIRQVLRSMTYSLQRAIKLHLLSHCLGGRDGSAAPRRRKTW